MNKTGGIFALQLIAFVFVFLILLVFAIPYIITPFSNLASSMVSYDGFMTFIFKNMLLWIILAFVIFIAYAWGTSGGTG